MTRRPLFPILLAILASAAPAFAQPVAQPLLALRSLDSRLASVADRLAVGAANLCPLQAWRPGFEIQHVSQYGQAGAAAANAAFGIGDYPAVLAVVPGGPADRAGLRADDWLLAVDDTALTPVPAGTQPSFVATRRFEDQIEAALVDGALRLRIRRGGREQLIEVHARRGCRTRFQMVPGTRLDARADGDFVQLTAAMVELAADDDELAGSLAHELAHNQLRHRLRLNESGLQRGLLEHFGRNARLRRQTEEQADRFSLYLMAAAGFDPAAAPRFLDRFLSRLGPMIDTTHPARAARLAAMREELTRIARLRAAGQPLRPAFDIGAQGPITPVR